MNKRIRLAAIAALILAIGAYAGGTGSIAAGPTRVGLGSADGFAVLAGTGITNTGATTITGDVGAHPTTTQTGFASVTLNGTNHLGDGVTQGAKTALTTAYLDAAGRTPVTTIATELGGNLMSPGTYTALSGTFGLTGTVTLDGAGDATSVYIFQMGTTLTTATNSVVTLTGGQQACNVFWQVGSSATIGGSTTFRGNILALTSITLVTGATVDGRLLARNGAVTLDTNTITRSDCAAAAPAAPGVPAPCCSSGTTPAPATPAPLVGTTPLPLPTPTTPPAIFPTLVPAPVATATPVPTVVPVGVVTGPTRLPGTATQAPDGLPAGMLLIAVAGLPLLALIRRARRPASAGRGS